MLGPDLPGRYRAKMSPLQMPQDDAKKGIKGKSSRLSFRRRVATRRLCTVLSLFLFALLSMYLGFHFYNDTEHHFISKRTLSKPQASKQALTLVMTSSTDTEETLRQWMKPGSAIWQTMCKSPSTDSEDWVSGRIVFDALNVILVSEESNEKLTAGGTHVKDFTAEDGSWGIWNFNVPNNKETNISSTCDIRSLRVVVPSSQQGQRSYHAAVRAGISSSPEETTYIAIIAGSLVPVTMEGAVGDNKGSFIERLASPLRQNGGRVAASQCTILNPSRKIDAAGEDTWRGFDTSAPFFSLSRQDLLDYRVRDKGVRVGYSAYASQDLTGHYLSFPLLGFDARDRRLVEFEEPIDAVSPFCGIFHRQLFLEAGGFMEPPTADNPYDAAAAPEYVGWDLSFRQGVAWPEYQFWSSTAIAVPSRPSEVPSNVPTSYKITSTNTQKWRQLLNQRAQWRLMGPGDEPWMSVKYNDPPVELPDKISTAFSPLPYVRVVARYCYIPCSGMTLEMVHYMTPLQSWGVPMMFFGDKCRWCASLPPPILEGLRRSHKKADKNSFDVDPAMKFIKVFHTSPDGVVKPEKIRGKNTPEYRIGRIITEMSRISPNEAQLMNDFLDEVWVTSEFFKIAYERSGIRSNLIRIMPESIDPYIVDPMLYEPLPEPLAASIREGESPRVLWSNRPLDEDTSHHFRFLSVFKWEPRKGWDTLLKAYWKGFGPGTPHYGNVTLIIKTGFTAKYSDGFKPALLGERLAEWAKENIPGFTSVEDFPHLMIITEAGIGITKLFRLYKTVNAFVLPTRAEGWGVPTMESMAMELPTITTNWGGGTAFCTRENSFPIPIDGLEELPLNSSYQYWPGKKYCIPSVEGTANAMRFVLENPEIAKEHGRRARRTVVENYTEEIVGTLMLKRMREIIQTSEEKFKLHDTKKKRRRRKNSH